MVDLAMREYCGRWTGPKKKALVAYNVPGYVPNPAGHRSAAHQRHDAAGGPGLTVDLGRIRDGNGLADVVYSYRRSARRLVGAVLAQWSGPKPAATSPSPTP